MPALSTGQIKYARAWLKVHHREQAVDGCLGILIVVLLIERMVVRGVEPQFKPFFWHIQVGLLVYLFIGLFGEGFYGWSPKAFAGVCC
jgi:hypothetical protein